LRNAVLAGLLLCQALLALSGCDRASAPNAPTAFQSDFIQSCVTSIQNPSFAWMPARYADGVCRCAAPRVETQLHQSGFDKGGEHSATELANASRIMTASTVLCARPVFVEVMTDGSKQQCLSAGNADPRLKALPAEARANACTCAAAGYGRNADLGLALQFEKHAEFERQASAQFGLALTQCGIK